MLAAIADDKVSLPVPTIICSPICRGSDVLSWPQWAVACTQCIYIHTGQHSKHSANKQRKSFVSPRDLMEDLPFISAGR